MRIGGLASGLDIDSMVKKLMTAEQVPLNKLNQQRQQTEWKREDYRQVSTRLVSFNDKLSTFNLSSSIDAKTATVTGATGVTAKATGSASSSNMSVTVNKLATASNTVYSFKNTVSSSQPVLDENGDPVLDENGDAVMENVTENVAVPTKISDIYNGTDSSISFKDAQGKVLSSISFSPSDTIQSLITKINNNKDAGVTAIFDASSGNISLTNKATGDAAVSSALTDFFSSGGKFTESKSPGSNAEVTVNGITMKPQANTFTVNGVELTVSATTPAGQSTQIQVSQDTDKVVDTIKSFVAAYNESLAYMNQEVNEERYRKFLPLTSEQKEAMSDDEIKLWEGKAKSGMLKNDSILNKTVSDMRAALSSDVIVNGQKVNLAQFGITTGAYGEKGKLHIDETKLREALEKDPAAATALFGQVDSSSNDSNGIFSRIKKINNTALQSLSEKAGTSKVSSDLSSAFLPQSQMGDQLSTYDKRIQTLQDRLTRVETNYYKQFTAMETAMNKYNSTMSSLSGMM